MSTKPLQTFDNSVYKPGWLLNVFMISNLHTMNHSIKYSSRFSATRATGFFALKMMLLIGLLATGSCTKDNLDNRILLAGTKCNIYSGVFGTGGKQPAQPVTVVNIYSTDSAGLIYYNVTDANGVSWQIPDNDLQVLQ